MLDVVERVAGEETEDAEIALIKTLSFGLLDESALGIGAYKESLDSIGRVLIAAKAGRWGEPEVSQDDKRAAAIIWKARASLLSELCLIWKVALRPIRLSWDNIDRDNECEDSKKVLDNIVTMGKAMGAKDMVSALAKGVPIEDIIA